MSADGDLTVGEVLTALLHSTPEKSDLRLVRRYQGILLEQAVRLLKFNSECATIQANDIRILVNLGEQVQLHSRYFPHPLVAQPRAIDLRKGEAQLYNLSRIDRRRSEFGRECVRPKNPLYVSLHWDENILRLPVIDLSPQSLRLFVYKYSRRRASLRPGEKVRLNFQLTSGLEMEGLHATLIQAHVLRAQCVEAILQLHPEPDEKRTLEKYFSVRKAEVLQELEGEYQAQRQPCCVENLFF